ncbi:MAG TPA: DUF1990 domain-containing protein, partial [Thermoanaerobaculia bacterium]
GLAQGSPAGYKVDEWVVTIGRGSVDFARAKAALSAWKHFDIGWLSIFPAAALPEPGSVVAILVRHLGFWSLNGARVVYGVGDRESARRFGFAYGTLLNHAEAGEELFEVFVDPSSEDVLYRLRAASRPRAPLARLGYPIVRRLQARFRRDSAIAMTRAVGVPEEWKP